VLERLAETDSTGTGPDPAPNIKRVYLVHDMIDRDATSEVRGQLERHGLRVMTPLFDGTEAEVREIHQDSLVLCDAVLIYYGEASEHWVRTKVNDLIKARGWGRVAPFLASGVIVGPPDTPAKAGFHTTEALLLEVDDQSALDRFLAELDRSGAGR